MTSKTILSIAAVLIFSTASTALADGAGEPQHSDRYLPQTSAPVLIEGRNVAVVRAPANMTATRESIATGYSGF